MNGLDAPARPLDVVVGYDGSPAAASAVVWAAREADLTGSRLRLITTVHPSAFPAGPYAGPVISNLRAAAEEVSTEGHRLAAKVLDEEDIVAEMSISGASSALIDASKDSSLVVVGSRGRGGAVSALLGSVSFSVSAHARCTVVVVPEIEGEHTDERPVVVGVDNTSASDTARQLAGDLADRYDRPLVVLAAWQRPMTPGLQQASWARPGPEWDDSLQSSAEERAASATAAARRRHPELTVETRVVEGPAGPTLSSASQTAHLVVVGTRGLGGFDGLLLGSVSRATLHRAGCPVVLART